MPIKSEIYSIFYTSIADYDMCHIIANKLVEQGDCKFSLKTFAIAAAKGRRCRSQLTPVHTDLCMLSLKAKHFKYALGYLQIDMTTISTGSETRPNYCVKYRKVKLTHFILFHYLIDIQFNNIYLQNIYFFIYLYLF